MHIILIKPNQDSNEIIPPLGLGYLASTVRNNNTIEIWDGICLKFTLKSFEKCVRKSNSSIFGIQSYSPDVPIVKKYIEIIRKNVLHAIIILGGPHISTWAIPSLKYFNECDFVFAGESEIGFPKLIELINEISNKSIKANPNCQIDVNIRKMILSDSNLKNIPGLLFRNNGKIIQNENILPCNLDDFNPSYDLLHLEKYPLAPHGGFCKQYPTAPIIITRGCPNQCNFCSGPLISGVKIRHHSVPYIINQLKYLKKKYHIREFHIEDDNFTANRSFVLELCDQLIQANLNMSWTAANGIRIDTLTKDLLELMIRSGMYSISVGIESSSDKIRKLMGKNLKTLTIVQKIQLIKKYNLDLIGFFILGYPGETGKDINKTIEFACKLPLKRANFATFKPFPGTKIFYDLIKNHQLKEIDWQKLTLHNIAWAPIDVGLKRLDYYRRKAWWKFYIRPYILLGIFKEIRNISNFKMVLLRIYHLLIRIQT